jgi:hypothetical protein
VASILPGDGAMLESYEKRLLEESGGIPTRMGGSPLAG